MEELTLEGTYDVRTMIELKRHLLSDAQIRLLAGIFCACVLLAGASLALRNTLFALIFGLLAVTSLLNVRIQYRRIYKVNLRRAMDKKRVLIPYRCVFSEEGVSYGDPSAAHPFRAAWSELRIVRETESGLYLVTRAGQILGLEKKGIAPALKERLYRLLRARGVRVKTN